MPIRKENCGNVNFLRTRRFVNPIYVNEISFSVLFNTNYEKQDEKPNETPQEENEILVGNKKLPKTGF